MDQAGLRFMVAEMESINLGKARILIAAMNNFSTMPWFASGVAKLIEDTPEAVMNYVVSEVPLGQVRYEALMERDSEGKYHPLTEDEMRLLSDGLLLGCVAVYARDKLSDFEYSAIMAPWNMVLEIPEGAEPPH